MDLGNTPWSRIPVLQMRYDFDFEHGEQDKLKMDLELPHLTIGAVEELIRLQYQLKENDVIGPSWCKIIGYE